MNNINFENLVQDGFIHIKSYLNPDELKLFVDDASAKKKESIENKNYSLAPLDVSLTQLMREKIKPLLHETNKTGNKADILEGGAYFSTVGGQRFPWHQDHESYYTCQNHTDYLNLYLSIIKPDKSKSNLSIIPFSVLKERSPELYNKIKGKGALNYYPENGETKVVDDNIGKVIHRLDYDINEIAVTPELEPGDLLLMSGDVIHQTQDTDTERISASIRILYSGHLVNYQKLIRGGSKKLSLMYGNQWLYNYMISVFRDKKTNEISIGDFLTTRYNVPVKIMKTKFTYYLYLLRLRVIDSLNLILK